MAASREVLQHVAVPAGAPAPGSAHAHTQSSSGGSGSATHAGHPHASIAAAERASAATPPGADARSQPSKFIVDPWAAQLAAAFAGSHAAAGADVPDAWGININAASPPPETLRAPYERLRQALLAALERAGAYVYPFDFLHVTVASPVPFTAGSIVDEREQRRLELAWLQAMRDCCVPQAGFPAEPFPLTFARVRLDRAAAIFEVEDPTGAIARCRAIVRQCLQHAALTDAAAVVSADGCSGGSPDAAAGGDPVPVLVARSGFKIPNIIHSTFLRFAAPADAGVSDADVEAAFAGVAAQWAPVTVMCDRLLLVREAAPYMHLALRGRNADAIIAELPFA
jgi:hypothetical protein